MAALDAALPDGVDIVVDAGTSAPSAIHYLPVRRDGRFIVALGMGGMGYSFGAGIGMAFGRDPPYRRDRRRRLFFMHGMEIHTAMQYRLPMTFLLFNNNAHAMCVTREQLFYGERYSYNRFAPSRLGAGLATMFPGLSSLDVEDDRRPLAGPRRRPRFYIERPLSFACSVLGGLQTRHSVNFLARVARRVFVISDQSRCRLALTTPPTQAQAESLMGL